MENIRELHRRAVDGIRPVLARITPADLDRPTPCAGWALRALLEHMAGQDHGFAATVRATRTGEEVDVAAFAPRPVGADPAPALTAGLDDLVAAFAQVGDEDGPVLLPEFGTRAPVPVVVHMHLIDTLVHGWDVAVATGQDTSAIAPELVAAAHRQLVPTAEMRRRYGAFGEQVEVPVARAGALAQLHQLVLELAHARVSGGEAFAQRELLAAAEAVEQVELGRRERQAAVLVLAEEGNQPAAELAQVGGSSRAALHERARAPAR